MSKVSELSRPVMRAVGRALLGRLAARAALGPAEPGLDGFIQELGPVMVRLDSHVGGQVLADAARKAMLARSETADDDVDTWLRHTEGFASVEANRRFGTNIPAAQALYAAAFADGLTHVDEYIPDENRACRDSIAVLRSPEHAPTVAAIGLPAAWITSWEGALDESDAAFAEVAKARAMRSQHVGSGEDAETDFVDVVLRLRRYIDSRAARTDKAKIAEGKELLAPLLEVLKKERAEQRARATRREHAEAPAPGPASSSSKGPASSKAPISVQPS